MTLTDLYLPSLTERVLLILLPSSEQCQCVCPFDQLQKIPAWLKQGEAALPQSFQSLCLNSPAPFSRASWDQLLFPYLH